MDLADTFMGLLISLGLGLLVGMQRERSGSRLGGIRTFALLTLFGAACAILGPASGVAGAWPLAAGMIAVVAAVIVGNLFSLRAGEGSPGVTSEIAMVIMYVVGAMTITGPREVAVVLGGGVAVLLHAKPILHALVGKLGDTDVRAIMQFALLTLVILPVVPDRTFGPYNVLNPHHIWLMVCLVVGISLAGYILYRVVGGSMGMVLAGLLGGLISSTATTVSYARRAREVSGTASLTSIVCVVLIAGTVVYGRVLVEIGAVSPWFLSHAAGPIGTLAGCSVLLAAIAWFRASRSPGELGSQKNPTELKSAMVFGGLYALVLFGAAAAQANMGSSGLYAVATVSGLTDMDSITLSVSRMTEQGKVEASTAWRAIMVGAMSNMVAKVWIIGVMGGPRMLRAITLFFGIKLTVAAAIIALWPG